MKRIFNYCTAVLFSVLGLTLGSCTEEYEYTGTSVSGEQVYFSNALSSTVELSATANSVTVPVNRIQRSGELTVNLDVSVPEGSPLTVSNTATFADGDSVAYITISYDPNAIEYGKYDTITVALNDASLTTPYGNTSYTFAAGLSEWVTMGTGSYCDGIMSYFLPQVGLTLDPMTYPVEIQKNVLTDGVYRVFNPYAEGTDFYNDVVVNNATYFSWTGGENTSLIIDARDPDFVYIMDDFYSGLTTTVQGQAFAPHFYSIVDINMEYYGFSLDQLKQQAPESFGQMRDGVIRFPAAHVGFTFGDFDPEVGVYSGNDATLAVALPGYVISDYSSSFAYSGCFIDIMGNSYIQGTVTLGDDVASAKYVIAANGDDVDAIIDAVNDGSIEATDITESGEVSIPMSESGDYNFIIITYDATGEMQGSSATPFTFNSGTVQDDTEWQFVCNGTYYHVISELFSDAGPLFEEMSYTTALYQDPEDPTRYRISPWSNNPYEELSFDFTMDANNMISFDGVYTGYQVEDTEHNVFTLYAADAYTLSNGQWPNSYYEPSENTYYFANVYYAIRNGEVSPIYGEWDAFVPDGAGQSALKGLNKAPYRLNTKANYIDKRLKAMKPGFNGKRMNAKLIGKR